MVSWPSKVSVTAVAGVLVSVGAVKALLLLHAATPKTAASAAADKVVRRMNLDLTWRVRVE
jgi:hypothetical protein